MIKKGESASKAVKRNTKDKKFSRDQLEQVQPSLEQLNEEELAYQEEQARLSRLRAESSGEEEGYEEDYVEDYRSSAEEEEQPLSKTKRGRTYQADEEDRVSQAVEDKLPPSAQKTRRLAKDLADQEVARLPQAEQSQGQATTNPSLPSYLPLSLNSTLVGAGIQNASSANANHSITYSNDGDFTPYSDRGRQVEAGEASQTPYSDRGRQVEGGETSYNSVSRLDRLNKIKIDSVNKQKIIRGLEIIRSQESINLFIVDQSTD